MSPQRIIELVCFIVFAFAAFAPVAKAPILGGISIADSAFSAIVCLSLAVLGVGGVFYLSPIAISSAKRGIVAAIAIELLYISVWKSGIDANVAAMDPGMGRNLSAAVASSIGFSWGAAALLMVGTTLVLSETIAINVFNDLEAEKRKIDRADVRATKSISPLFLYIPLSLMVAISFAATVFGDDIKRLLHSEASISSGRSQPIHSPTKLCKPDHLYGSDNVAWRRSNIDPNRWLCGDAGYRRFTIGSVEYRVRVWMEGPPAQVVQKHVSVIPPTGFAARDMLLFALGPHIKGVTSPTQHDPKKGYFVPSAKGHKIYFYTDKNAEPGNNHAVLEILPDVDLEI